MDMEKKSIILHIKDIELLEDITTSLVYRENHIMAIWFGFEDGIDYYEDSENNLGNRRV